MGFIARVKELTYRRRGGGGGGLSPVGGGGSGIAYTKTVSTGALALGDNVIVHNMGYTYYGYELHDTDNIASVNKIYPDPADPTNNLIINVSAPIPGGLTLIITGSNT